VDFRLPIDEIVFFENHGRVSWKKIGIETWRILRAGYIDPSAKSASRLSENEDRFLSEYRTEAPDGRPGHGSVFPEKRSSATESGTVPEIFSFFFWQSPARQSPCIHVVGASRIRKNGCSKFVFASRRRFEILDNDALKPLRGNACEAIVYFR
jgi:hypothetical protein